MPLISVLDALPLPNLCMRVYHGLEDFLTPSATSAGGFNNEFILKYRVVICLIFSLNLILANSCSGHSNKKCPVVSSSFSQYGQLGSAPL